MSQQFATCHRKIRTFDRFARNIELTVDCKLVVDFLYLLVVMNICEQCTHAPKMINSTIDSDQ